MSSRKQFIWHLAPGTRLVSFAQRCLVALGPTSAGASRVIGAESSVTGAAPAISSPPSIRAPVFQGETPSANPDQPRVRPARNSGSAKGLLVLGWSRGTSLRGAAFGGAARAIAGRGSSAANSLSASGRDLQMANRRRTGCCAVSVWSHLDRSRARRYVRRHWKRPLVS